MQPPGYTSKLQLIKDQVMGYRLLAKPRSPEALDATILTIKLL